MKLNKLEDNCKVTDQMGTPNDADICVTLYLGY